MTISRSDWEAAEHWLQHAEMPEDKWGDEMGAELLAALPRIRLCMELLEDETDEGLAELLKIRNRTKMEEENAAK